ncbi:TPA: hypothetical protein ACX6SP_003654 [Photobacterium damselae]
MITAMNHAQIINTVSSTTALTYEQETGYSFVITLATEQDIQEARTWPLVGHNKYGYGNMQWQKIFNRQKFKSKKFLCALRAKDNNELLGLMGGRISFKDEDGTNVSIDYLERSKNATILKGHAIIIALKFAYIMADLLKLEYVKVNNPAAKLIELYQLEMPGSSYKKYRQSSYIIAPTVISKLTTQ